MPATEENRADLALNPSGPMAVVEDELELLRTLVPLRDLDIVELGCGKAELARRLVASCAGCTVAAIEIDQRQHASNLEQTVPGISFVLAGAQAIPFEDGRFDLALMLKSLHHVPLDLLDQAIGEVHRVLRAGGLFYVSEPVFAGDLNDVIRLFHDEQEVRRAAYMAVQRAQVSGLWETVDEIFFDMPVVFRDFADFEQRIVNVTFADHRLDNTTRERVRERFERHRGRDGARFLRPMRVNLLRKHG